MRFHPEVIVVGPDPKSGLLTKRFTVFHEIENASLLGLLDKLCFRLSITQPSYVAQHFTIMQHSTHTTL